MRLRDVWIGAESGGIHVSRVVEPAPELKLLFAVLVDCIRCLSAPLPAWCWHAHEAERPWRVLESVRYLIEEVERDLAWLDGVGFGLWRVLGDCGFSVSERVLTGARAKGLNKLATLKAIQARVLERCAERRASKTEVGDALQ